MAGIEVARQEPVLETGGAKRPRLVVIAARHGDVRLTFGGEEELRVAQQANQTNRVRGAWGGLSAHREAFPAIA